MRKIAVRASFVAVVVLAPLGLALAQSKTSLKSHPNLFAAQKLCAQAYDKLTAAQKANEYDLGGHAAKAKDLLEKASAEIKAAAAAAEERK